MRQQKSKQDEYIFISKKVLLLFFSLFLILPLFSIQEFYKKDGQTVNKSVPNKKAIIPEKKVVYGNVEKIVNEKGASAGWQYFRSKAKDLSTSGAHDIAHYLGGRLYQEVSLNALDLCDTSFAFGCYHGVLEELIHKHGISRIESAVTYCNKFSFDTMITCYHGIGHGILSYYKYALSPALIHCDQLLTNEASYCYRGVFMEHALELTQKVKKENPLWPCNEISDRYKASCYDYQMIYLSYLFPDRPQDLAISCQQAEKEEYTIICLEGIGHMLAQKTMYNPNRIFNECQIIDEKSYPRCMIAAAVEVVFQTNDATKSQQICSHLQDTDREECYARSGKQVR